MRTTHVPTKYESKAAKAKTEQHKHDPKQQQKKNKTKQKQRKKMANDLLYRHHKFIKMHWK